MIKSKLHNPIIAKNSYIENAVVEKVSSIKEKVFSDIGNIQPVVPEIGRIWFNTELGTFKFANIGNGVNYVDEFLSRTDLRAQNVVSTVDFNDTVRVNNKTDGSSILKVDSNTQDISIDGNNIIINLNENLTENISGNQQTNISENMGIKVDKTILVQDKNNNIKIKADNILNSLTINYSEINFNGKNQTHTLSDKFIINDGINDKFIIDNTQNKVSIVYNTIETNGDIIKSDVLNNLTVTDGINDKIVADHINNSLNLNYADMIIQGNTRVDGNMVVSGDLIVGGKTTKVDVAAENMTIADNVVILNSNLDLTVDPRLASTIVDGTDVDANAGLAVNRGSEGILDLIKWVESTDVTTLETLKEGTANVSIWNYEAAIPSYELHQIIDAYTLGRQIVDKSGASWIGYDGYEGINYTNAINAGATSDDASNYSFKIKPDQLDNVVDTLVQEIDNIKFDDNNSVRVGQTVGMGTEFTITHNLGTVFVDVRIQREDEGNWYFDTLPIQVIDENTIKIVSTEITRIRYMISAIQGFDVNHATELVIV